MRIIREDFKTDRDPTGKHVLKLQVGSRDVYVDSHGTGRQTIALVWDCPPSKLDTGPSTPLIYVKIGTIGKTLSPGYVPMAQGSVQDILSGKKTEIWFTVSQKPYRFEIEDILEDIKEYRP